MKRTDFMNQLESLLQSIPSTEREEAMQYYNDYFDDAGAENEQQVIEALGNPARVAENIKRDLLGSAEGEAAARKVKASDRVVMKYGQNNTDSQSASEEGDKGKGGSIFSDYGRSSQDTMSQSTFASGNTFHYDQDASGSASYSPEKPKKEGMPVWAIAMLVTVLVFGFPVIAGVALAILGTVFGLLAAWFGMIFGFGVTAVVLLLVLVVLVVTGIICLFANPWVGMAMIGGGLVCGCIGILFLMLTVAMAGILTPAIFRGIGSLFRLFRKKPAKATVR
ncbi:MAG: DUF1700 domain-containing protein [Lachnospiraceae bacterium]|jgi:hypothetical protein|nr:DUF1700 domain-containing protein [Lachnospiraceae bacterium]